MLNSGDQSMQRIPLSLAPDLARRRKAIKLPNLGADVCLVCVYEAKLIAPPREVAFSVLGAAWPDAAGGIIHWKRGIDKSLRNKHARFK